MCRASAPGRMRWCARCRSALSRGSCSAACIRLAVAPGVGEDFAQHALAQRAQRWVCDGIVRNQPDCLTDRDAAAAAPGVVVGTDQVTEDVTRVLAEDAPRRIEVCRGVTEAGRAEVEHRPETTLANQKIRWREIAVDPAVGAVPCRPV